MSNISKKFHKNIVSLLEFLENFPEFQNFSGRNPSLEYSFPYATALVKVFKLFEINCCNFFYQLFLITINCGSYTELR